MRATINHKKNGSFREFFDKYFVSNEGINIIRPHNPDNWLFILMIFLIIVGLDVIYSMGPD